MADIEALFHLLPSGVEYIACKGLGVRLRTSWHPLQQFRPSWLSFHWIERSNHFRLFLPEPHRVRSPLLIASFSASAIVFLFCKSTRLSCACAIVIPQKHESQYNQIRSPECAIPRMRSIRLPSFEAVIDPAWRLCLSIFNITRSLFKTFQDTSHDPRTFPTSQCTVGVASIYSVDWSFERQFPQDRNLATG